MGSWGENTEESPVRAHLKLFHLFIVSAGGAGAGVLRKLYRLTLTWKNHDFSIVSVTSHCVDVLQALLHF